MLQLLRHRLTPRIVFTLWFELIAVNLGLWGILYARFAAWGAMQHASEHTFLIATFACTVTLVIFFVLWSFSLYSKHVIYCGRAVYLRLAKAFAFLTAALFPICYAFGSTGIPIFTLTLRFYAVLLVVFMVVVGLERYLILKIFRESNHYGNALILGDGEPSRQIIREARRHHGDSLHFVGIVSQFASDVGELIEGVPVVGTLADTARCVRDLQVHTIILCLPCDNPDLPVDSLLECKLSGIQVREASAFYEALGQKVLLEKLDPFTLLLPDGFNMTRLSLLWKEASEKALALAALTALAAPMALVALLVRWTSPGPVIYRQRRVGRAGKVFTLYKFRTMAIDAEAGTGPVWARKHDRRVTPVGKWLRRLRFDESPQLINILKGDMAFVGPRPERPEFVEALQKRIPFYGHRHFVKPGLTGWAQVAFQYAATLDDAREKLRYDLYYVKHLSPLFDLCIIVATLKAVATGKGLT